jgi:ElaB/YqjD/DUF883 family membrane-anchored ribosome-binding protein
MHTQIQEVRDDVAALAKDARALIAATAHVAEEGVVEARARLAAALDHGKEMCGRARDQAAAGIKAADQVVHEHPYQAIGIAAGLGALFGYLVSRRCPCSRE